MSTVVVARKGDTLAIASGSLVSFGEKQLPPGWPDMNSGTSSSGPVRAQTFKLKNKV